MDEDDIQEKFYLGDGEHYFIYRSDKYNGSKLAELFQIGKPNGLKLLIANNWNDVKLSHHQVIENFETFVMPRTK